MTKLILIEKRKKALKELSDMALTRHGAMDIANYFISTVSWTKLIEAHKKLLK